MIPIRSILSKSDQLPHPGGSGCYQNLEVIGSGASCVVYHAEFLDHSGLLTEHLLKEYNPAHLHMERLADGRLMPEACDRADYESGLDRFRSAYILQRDIRRDEQLKNSTSSIQGVFDANGTAYIDMTDMAGQTYSRAEEPSLYELLRRMKALAAVIGNYHRAGFLHLDIKPENIFVYPETPEMLMLFDFDSVVRKNSIPLTKGLSYTKGWAAPELLTVSGRRKICEATDLYSIGEILFYRLFGRHSEPEERRSFSSFPHDLRSPLLKNVNPKVFPLLTELLHKTLCVTPEKRYQHADEMIGQLDKLIGLADPKLFFVKGNFTYQSACFYGREALLDEIHAFFSAESNGSGNALFLRGVGGIGKTELAKRYAYLHQKEYTRILFLPFQNSIEDTLCHGSFEIHHGMISADDDLSPKPDYPSLLRILKDDLTPNDLILLDNFDVLDEKIQDLLEINCKILVTTRHDVSDYDFPQKLVGTINETDALWEVFRHYDRLDYSDEECAQIEALMDYVDHHTMTICLISKYLRENGDSPSNLLKTLKSKEGITAAQESTRIGHRKDRRMTQKSVHDHLRILFDLSHFSPDEIDFLASLSLFGSVRIAEDALRQLFGPLYQESTLQRLVNAGWVERSGDAVVSLHQIILDLCYETLPHKCCVFDPIVQNLLKYLQGGAESRNLRRGKHALAALFLERVSPYLGELGENAVSVAELSFLTSKNGRGLDAAENICQRFSTRKSYELRFKIELERIHLEGERYADSLFEDVDETFSTTIKNAIFACERSAWGILFHETGSPTAASADAASHIEQLTVPDSSVCDKTDAANLKAFLAHVSILPDRNRIRPDLFDALLALAQAVESAADRFCQYDFELSEDDAACSLYREEECILRYAYLLSVTTKQGAFLLEHVLERLSAFYNDDDYSHLARNSRFADPLKLHFYTFELRKLRQLYAPGVIMPDPLWGDSYIDAAADETGKGNYQKARSLLQMALENREGSDEAIVSRISWNDIQHDLHSGMLPDAYDRLLDHWDHARKNDLPDIDVLMTLADVCNRMGRKEEAIRWYRILMEEHIRFYDDLNEYDRAELLLACCLRAELDEQYRADSSFRKWMVEHLLEAASDDWVVPVLLEVCQKSFDILRDSIGFSDAIGLLLQVADKRHGCYDAEAEALYALVCEACRQEDKAHDLCFSTALKAVGLFSVEPLPNRSKFLEILKDLSKKPELISALDLERYHVLQVELYHSQEDSDDDTEALLRRKCNYYLIAEHDAKACEDLDAAIHIWENARDEYLQIDDCTNAKRCCMQIDALLSGSGDPRLLCSRSAQKHYEELLKIECRLKSAEGMDQCIQKLYRLWQRMALQDDRQEDRLLDSMQQTVAQAAAIPCAAPAILIGLFRIHRVLLGQDFVFPENVLMFDQPSAASQIHQMVDALPGSVPDHARDRIDDTLQIIAPLYHSAFPESVSKFDRFQKACAFCEIEVKHIK